MDRNTFVKMTRGNFFDRLFAYMDSVGLDCIRVNYSGGGDSGGVDNIDMMPNKVSQKVKDGLVEFCEEDLANPIYDRHGSFADGGGFNVDGVVVYDAKAKTINISGTDHYYEYAEDGENENCRDEEWYNDIYEQTEDDDLSDSDSDYSFAYLYARDYLKSRLPDEFHNEILIAATEQEGSAVKYIKEFGKIKS